MADITWRANLAARKFPLLSSKQARTVIVRGQDQNYIPQLTDKENIVSDISVPQLYFAENIVPTVQGYQSVGFQQFVAAKPSVGAISKAFVVRNETEDTAVIGFDSVTGTFYSLAYGGSEWVEVDSIAAAVGKQVSVAHVSGTTYIMVEGYNCYKYNFSTGNLDVVTLTGLTIADIICIAGSNGYLLAFSKDAVAWSSTIDPTDFVASLSTGAGGGNIEDSRGSVVTVVKTYSGITVFTTQNAVAGVYSGNPRYPFNFSEVVGSGGLSDPDYVAYYSNSAAVFAYTTSGLQSISARQATPIYPDITDFLSGQVIETFDHATNTITSQNTGVMQKKLTLVADRYLVISYGSDSSPMLTHAIVIDTALNQYGKLRVDHRDVFDFSLYDQTVYETPKKSIGIIGNQGSLNVVDFTFSTPNHNAVAILGKYQYVRSRLLQLQGVEVDNCYSNFSCYDIPSIDGKNFLTPIAGYELINDGLFRSYNFHNTALNHSMLFKGTMDLTTLSLTFNIGGAR